MTRQHPRQPLSEAAQQAYRLHDVLRGPGEFTGLLTRRSLMTVFDFPSPDAVRQFAKRHGIRFLRRGQKVVYDPRDFHRVMAASSAAAPRPFGGKRDEGA